VNQPTDRLNAALAGRYQIEKQLGQGGMATVYRAQDLKHDRQVAIKVLKPELAAVLGAERFVQEIKTTAALQHPHILPLFDSGSADGFLYYVMPCIEGETLRARLEREHQLGVDEALQIATHVAGALDFAHRRGIVHRDIKPENILLQEGMPLVADFGIAVAVSTAGGDRLTETGLSLGTPAYMSPEQAAGERDLDARSDVYALACVTYEMLAGDPPFVAKNAAAIIARHMTDVAPPITTVRRNVGAAVATALARALHKAPADRYPSAGEFAAALRSPAGTAPADAAPIIVVLPFANTSGDPDNEYFSDGLTEEVIADLSKVRALRVISRNSAMTLKGTTKDTPTLARELGVSHVVTGSVRRAGTALRVTVELVQTRTDESVWGEKYTGTTDDVFGIQEEIARKIVAALQMTLTESEARQVAARPIDDPVAYDCYLRARHTMYAWTPDASQRGLRLVDDALAIVGDTPLLLATKAQLFWNEVNMNLAPADARLPRATEYVERALAIEPRHALAIFVRGLVAGSRGRPEEALPDLYLAHELWPGDANILSELCRFSNTAGLRHHGTFVDRLVSVDPLTALTALVVSSYHWTGGRHEAAVEPARRACEMSEPASMVPIVAGAELAASGRKEEAAGILGRTGTLLAGTPLGREASFLQFALLGDRDAARRHEPTGEDVIQNEFAAMFTAQAYALIGRREDALRWLRKAVRHGFINYPFLAEHDPFFGDLRADPGFRQILTQVKPRWEAAVEWERRQRPSA
jgi:serine/threonine protein kinase/tetratricopeptide (TPR) repeat protein